MKKQYEVPKAERYVFKYQENVVASLGNVDGPPNPHANPNSANSCTTYNTSNIVTSTECSENAIPKP